MSGVTSDIQTQLNSKGTGNGTVTQVNTGTGMIGGPVTTTGTVSVDVGTTAGKIVQLDGTGKLPAVDGSALTGIVATNALSLEGQPASYYTNASNLSTGTISDSRLSSNVVTLTGAQSLSNKTFTGTTTMGVVAATSYTGDGSGLNGIVTSLASQGAATLTGGVTLIPGTSINLIQDTGAKTITINTVGAAGGTVTSVGPGNGITTSPNPITGTGTVAIDTGVVATLNGAQTLTNKTFTGTTTMGAVVGTSFTGDGSGLTGITATNATSLEGQPASYYTNVNNITGGTLSPTHGGTGLTSYNTGDLIYSPSANTLSKLGVGSTGQHLVVRGGIPSWEANTSGVTSITASTGLLGGTITTTGTVSVDVGTTAGKIVQLNGSAQLPAVDGSQLTGLTKGQVGLGNVENTALSTWAGSTNITTLGTISSGTVPVARVSGLANSATIDATNASNIGSGTVNNTKFGYLSGVTSDIQTQLNSKGTGNGTVTQVNTGTGMIGGPVTTTGTVSVDVGTTAGKIVQLDGTGKLPAVDGSQLTNLTKTQVGLSNVENTALSTWAGSTNITTLGTISTGSIPASKVTGLANSATIDATNAANITSGILPDARLSANVVLGSSLGTFETIAAHNSALATYETTAALGTWAGSSNITTLGTISSGTVPVARVSGLANSATIDATNAANIGSGTVNNTKFGYLSGVTSDIQTQINAKGTGTVTQVNTGTGMIGGPVTTTGTVSVDVGTTAGKIVQLDGTGKLPAVDGSQLTNLTKTQVGLSNVENTALSTWAGSSNITTLGTISSGTVPVARVSGLANSATIDATNAANIGSGTVNNTKFGYLSGVTSDIQTQINAKGTGTVTQVNTGAGLTGGPITSTGTVSIGANAITAAMMGTGSVTSDAIAANAVTGTKIASATIDGSKLISGININTTGVVTASAFSIAGGGTLVDTTSAQSISNKTFTGTTTMGAVTATTLNTSGLITGGAGLNLTGTATATAFSGNGSALTSLNGSNISSGTVGTTVGGTGLTSYTTGEVIYASATNTLNKLSAVATGNALISGGLVTAPSWGKIGLATHVSGNLPVTNLNSGTGASSSTFWRGDGTWATPAGSGTVTQVNTSRGIIGGPITTTGTITIDTAVVVTTNDAQSLSNKTFTGTTTMGVITLTTPLGPTSGGTGLSTYTTGDILYSPSANTLTKLAVGSAGQHLVVRSGIPSWETSGGSGTVTSVGSGRGLIGGPITTTGTLTIDTTVVVTTNDAQSLSNKTFTGTTAMGAITATNLNASGLITGGAGLNLTGTATATAFSGTSMNLTGVATADTFYGTFEGTYRGYEQKAAVFVNPFATAEAYIRLPFNASISSIEVFRAGGTAMTGQVDVSGGSTGSWNTTTASVLTWYNATGTGLPFSYVANSLIKFSTPIKTGAVTSGTISIVYRRSP